MSGFLEGGPRILELSVFQSRGFPVSGIWLSGSQLMVSKKLSMSACAGVHFLLASG